MTLPLDAKIVDFIETHRTVDVKKLALSSGRYPDVDMHVAIQQIAGWQQARLKIPSWAAKSGILYPPHLNMEQCSSEPTARYKADIARRLGGDEMAVLTGGLGVDFAFLSQLFRRSVYVEQNDMLCQIAENNFRVLGLDGVSVVCDDCCDYLDTMPHVALIYLDPARRDASGGRTFAMSDCRPDVVSLAPVLLSKADHVMVKLSPMLDWHAVVDELPNVAEIHIVAVGGECKEIVAVMSSSRPSATTVFCIDGEQEFSFDTSERCQQKVAGDVTVGQRLFEPGASVMKSGEWGIVCRRYGVKAIAENSHLFVSDADGQYHPSAATASAKFPGREFVITRISSMNRREMKEFLSDVDRANITVRNFPMSVAELRRRLKIADGGDSYIFATTTDKGNHMLIMCKKTS